MDLQGHLKLQVSLFAKSTPINHCAITRSFSPLCFLPEHTRCKDVSGLQNHGCLTECISSWIIHAEVHIMSMCLLPCILFLIFFPLEFILPGPQKSSQPKKLSEENYTDRTLDDMASAWAPTVIANLFTFSLPHISVVWTSFSPWNRYVGITWISSPFSRQPEKNRWRSWCRSYQWNKLYPWWDGELLHRLVVCSFGRD